MLVLIKTMFSGPHINHGTPLKATMAIEIKANVWIVAVIDGKTLKMIKLRITGASTYVWIESKWSNSYASSCSNQNTFTEQCFVGKSVGIDFYKISVAAESKGNIPHMQFTEIILLVIFPIFIDKITSFN